MTQELEDYIRTQKDLGVREHDIRSSLLKAGYSSEEFEHLIAKHSRTAKSRPAKETVMTTKHVIYMNIAAIVVFGMLFAYISYDYNTKLQDLALEQEKGFNRTETLLEAQDSALSSLKAQTSAQDRRLSSDINQTKTSILSIRGDMDSKLSDYNYQALQRDAALQSSFLKISNRSLSELSSFSAQLDKFKEATVDFSPIIPKAIEAVVTLGKKGSGFFQTAGSGVFINNKGYIITNWHVIDELKPISVKTSNDKDYTATIVGKDEGLDIAVIKLDTKQQNFTFLEFADSSEVKVGDHVIAVGNPVGFDSTVTEGIISNTKRLIAGETQSTYYLQTDVAINAGNSGGPLIDKEGQIVGIATLKYAASGVEGLSFALRSNEVQKTVLEILQEEASI